MLGSNKSNLQNSKGAELFRHAGFLNFFSPHTLSENNYLFIYSAMPMRNLLNEDSTKPYLASNAPRRENRKHSHQGNSRYFTSLGVTAASSQLCRSYSCCHGGDSSGDSAWDSHWAVWNHSDLEASESKSKLVFLVINTDPRIFTRDMASRKTHHSQETQSYGSNHICTVLLGQVQFTNQG